MRRLRLGLAQFNATVGDLTGNCQRIKDFIQEARSLKVDLLAFPELAITGYPPEDLLLKPHFTRDNIEALQEVVRASSGIAVVVGFVDSQEDLYNAAALIYDGRLAGVYHKTYLPNYGVFDEDRYFQTGGSCPIYLLYGVRLGLSICEDLWYPGGPVAAQARAGAELVVNINASPYHMGKQRAREKMIATRAADNNIFIAYLNLVGGQDELVFDGNSVVVDERGEVVARGKSFEEDLIIADLDVERIRHTRLHDPRRRKEKLSVTATPQELVVSAEPPVQDKPPLPPRPVKALEGEAEVYAALVMGTRDYVRKNGFRRVLIGLSGGVDSSLVTCIAVDALGKENVTVITMPSPFSSPGSITDSQLLARNLGIELKQIPIADTFDTYLRMLAPVFAGTQPGVAEENIQARIRGNILMALSNKFGWLVLTTGNKSEMATGYATLYGDMAGGFAVIKDVHKTWVYRVARFANRHFGKKVVPESVLRRVPTAELKPNQTDQDVLPTYDKLDAIIRGYVEERRPAPEIRRRMRGSGVNVDRVLRMIDH
ncbi:MAG: NAD+ synthase, partial [Chloroflexota bacterium]